MGRGLNAQFGRQQLAVALVLHSRVDDAARRKQRVDELRAAALQQRLKRNRRGGRCDSEFRLPRHDTEAGQCKERLKLRFPQPFALNDHPIVVPAF